MMRLRSALGYLTFAVALIVAVWTPAAPADAVPADGRPTQLPAPWFTTLVHADGPVSDSAFCGGALISSTRVATAAHCVEEQSSRDFRVLLGDRPLSAGAGEALTVKGISINPDYRLLPDPASDSWEDATAAADIAVIELAEPVLDVTPVELAAVTPSAGDEVTLLGHGRTREQRDARDVPPRADRLARSAQVVIDAADCRARSHGQVVDPTMLCTALPPESADATPACSGDSGGPLVAQVGDRAVLVGLLSAQTSGAGTICQNSRSAALSTEVSRFGNWLTGSLQLAPSPIGPVRIESGADGKLRCAAPEWVPGTAPVKTEYEWYYPGSFGLDGTGDMWFPIPGETRQTYGGLLPREVLGCGVVAENTGGSVRVDSVS